MFAPIILGSDKTTVSVATGDNSYYPLYAGIGNAQNHVRRAHRHALSVIAFLAIPKSTCPFWNAASIHTLHHITTADKEFQDSIPFRTFNRQLFHTSLIHILSSVRPWM